MIRYFPKIYPDELIYSNFARYYIKSGYIAYRHVAEDLYVNPTIKPNIEFINLLTNNAFKMVTKFNSIDAIIEKHTMFPFYGRFLNKERKNEAFKALCLMQSNFNYLLCMPKNNTNRYLRYCPICVNIDREKYGETYWHRIHQLQNINICPIHHCNLVESDIIINGKSSPMLISAENVISQEYNVINCENKIEIKLAEYVKELFLSNININSNVLVGDFLHSKLKDTKYCSIRGKQRNISLLYNDFIKYYEALPNNSFKELWQVQKIFTNNKYNIVEICMLAMFLNILPIDLDNMALPPKTQTQLFDEEIFKLRKEGLKYPEIAKRLNASINVVKVIGEKRYGIYHKERKKTKQSKVKTKDWEKMDIDLLPKVKEAIIQLKGNGIDRPKKITIFAIEKILGLKSKQLNNLPACKKEIQKYTMSQCEYWAIEIIWAINILKKEGKTLNWKNIRNLTNIRRENFISCYPYLLKLVDDELIDEIKNLLKT